MTTTERVVATAYDADPFDSRAGLLPLLFSSGTYQRYPDPAVRNKRWDVLAGLTSTYSATRGLREIDFAGAASIDEWIDRVSAGGHIVFASGDDREGVGAQPERRGSGRPGRPRSGLSKAQRRPVFVLSSSTIGHRQPDVDRATGTAYSTPERTFWLADEPLSFRGLFVLADPRTAIRNLPGCYGCSTSSSII
jgi:hypothetical protein